MPKNIEFQSHRFLDQWVFKLSPQYKGYVTPTCCQIDIDRVEQVFVFTSHLFSRWMNDIGPIYLCSQSCPGSLKEVRLGLFFQSFVKDTIEYVHRRETIGILYMYEYTVAIMHREFKTPHYRRIILGIGGFKWVL